ncbi:MAG: hypothetical protein K6E16_11815 [Lachnospiraceae bacterium]|nr:hypothetical protein [Lachnospiraceae bacterium]
MSERTAHARHTSIFTKRKNGNVLVTKEVTIRMAITRQIARTVTSEAAV